MTEQNTVTRYPARRWLLMGLFALGMGALLWRAADLQLMRNVFLQDHGDARSLRVVEIPAHRGMVTDRYGEPLAVSTPVHAVWATPRQLLAGEGRLPELAKLLNMDVRELKTLLEDRVGREFVYLRRHLDPGLAQRVAALGLPGVSLGREYRRYYPASEVTAHILGFTNVDDIGQEGIELAFDKWLRGTPGAKRVLKDRLGRIVENVESIRPSSPGQDLVLSIDRRVQYLAYRELKAAVQRNAARGGSIVMLDAKSGEVLAMVSQPSYNPNNRGGLKRDYFRNRAVTDVFEPGSAIKPFTIASAIETGKYTPATVVDTRPGYISVGGHTIRDLQNYGVIDVATVIKKSSNVGASKIALSLDPKGLWVMLTNVGFGQITDSGFPGEASGHLDDYRSWPEVEHATLAFGYGLSVTALQLAQAYTVLAADGLLYAVTLQKLQDKPQGQRVMKESTAAAVRSMLEAVVHEGGTGQLAQITGYRVAGKTGTVHKSIAGGYAEDRYVSVFAGMAPATRPRLVMVVVIDEPRGHQHFGGQVAAPVFSKVMGGAMRLMNIAPDDTTGLKRQRLAYVNEVSDGGAGGGPVWSSPP